MNEVDRILAGRYPSYQEPLRQAWTWNREGSADSLHKGETLSRALKQRYPNVLQVRYELAFALVRQKRRPEAIRELQAAAREFPVLDEDCLSLLGRCHKDSGDDHLRQGLPAPAQIEYREAEQWYEKAHAQRHDRFPGINIAGLRLIRASLSAVISELEPSQTDALRKQVKTLLQGSGEAARDLLAKRHLWEARLSDDNIWIAATQGEAHLLLQEWESAAQYYRQALSQPNLQPFHAESMQAQVVRFLAAYGRLKIVPQGPLANPEKFFDNAPASAGPT